MKYKRFTMLMFAVLGAVSPFDSKVFGEEPSSSENKSPKMTATQAAREDAEAAVREYLKKKHAVTVKEKGGDLIISGDVHCSWHHLTAKTAGRLQRGWESRKLAPNDVIQSRKVDLLAWKQAKSDAKDKKKKDEEAHILSQKEIDHKYKKSIRKAKMDYRDKRNKRLPPFGKNEFFVEANLVFDYRADRGWATIQLQFDNPAGTNVIDRKALVTDNRRIMFGSGKRDAIALKRAYAGYNIWSEGPERLDVEVGRRKMYDIFDSKIEFDSYFDGIYGRYVTTREGLADFSLKAGAFVVDSTVNHYGFVGEAAMMNIVDSGVDLKYSLIDWERRNHNRYGLKHPLGTRFLNSQFLCNYTMDESLCPMKPRFYGAYLVNSKAKPTHWTHGKRANEAFYVGHAMGEIKKKGDWSYEILYQWVQAQAIPERDVRDVGRDNPRKISFYNRRSGGFANYKGWRFDFFYALTGNWTLHPFYENEKQINKSIGGKHHSTEFTIETVFAF